MVQKNLLLQTHRLGDLIMTYPLCTWLTKDNRSIWLVGEENFFKDLLRFSPKKVFYVPVEAQNELLKEEFHQLINLSHSKSASCLAYKVKARHKIGALENHEEKNIRGLWQLYCTSLTHNNHYNRFHWAELNALDSVVISDMQKTKYPIPRVLSKGRIGLFVGASDKAKRPDVEFWADLALSLAKKGYQPVFLGGSNAEEMRIAQRAANIAKMPRSSLAGRFSLIELAAFLQTLDLFITPDTGPMHMASMQGVPTFNLSLGPVHPWETAPYQPHHYVLRSSISCSGCWQCTKSRQICKDAFIPSRISALIHALLQKTALPKLPSLCLYKTTRTKEGLYQLHDVYAMHNRHTAKASASRGNTAYINEDLSSFRDIQGDFWRYFFADYIQNHNTEASFSLEYSQDEILQNSHIFKENIQECTQALKEKLPKLHALLVKEHITLIKEIMLLSKKNAHFSPEAWKEHPIFMRPLTSFSQLMLENEGYSKEAKTKVIHLLENFGKNLIQ